LIILSSDIAVIVTVIIVMLVIIMEAFFVASVVVAVLVLLLVCSGLVPVGCLPVDVGFGSPWTEALTRPRIMTRIMTRL